MNRSAGRFWRCAAWVGQRLEELRRDVACGFGGHDWQVQDYQTSAASGTWVRMTCAHCDAERRSPMPESE